MVSLLLRRRGDGAGLTFFSESDSEDHLAPSRRPTSPEIDSVSDDETNNKERKELNIPKLAWGFSCLILSLQSWEKNMYALWKEDVVR